MGERTVTEQVTSGVRVVGNVLLGFVIAVLLFGAANFLLCPQKTQPGSFAHAHPLAIGLLFLGAVTTILIVRINSWVKVLPAILAYAVFGGMLVTLTGHLSAMPSAKVSRLDAAILTALLAAGSVVSRTFTRHELSLIDRIGLLAYALGMGLGVGYDACQVRSAVIGADHSVLFICVSSATGCLLFVAVYDSLRCRASAH